MAKLKGGDEFYKTILNGSVAYKQCEDAICKVIIHPGLKSRLIILE